MTKITYNFTMHGVNVTKPLGEIKYHLISNSLSVCYTLTQISLPSQGLQTSASYVFYMGCVII